jgi:hypothetical protein
MTRARCGVAARCANALEIRRAARAAAFTDAFGDIADARLERDGSRHARHASAPPTNVASYGE